jgi:hypothetical protein
MNVHANIYVLGSQKSSAKPATLSLYKLMIDSNIKNKVSLDHFLVVPNVSLNENRLQIDINFDVSIFLNIHALT